MGWIGMAHQLEYTLRSMGADTDEDGRILITGSAPVSFMGMGEEMVIDDECMYLVNGQKASVAIAMKQTSYGVPVNVL
jgi:hypothetical protein